MKKIYIYIPNKNASSIMKTNIFKLLKNDNIKIINKLIIDKNSIYYILKHVNIEMVDILQKLKSLNNYLIYEPLDIEWKEMLLHKYLNKIKDKLLLFDHIICNNTHILNLYREICPKLHYTTIYHEYDMRFKPEYNPRDMVVYIGSLGKSSLTNMICMTHNIVVITPDNSFINNNHTCIHIDYIKHNTTYYHLHTATKLATALCFNSIFITNRVPVYVELLGTDYEFYINDDLSDLAKIINKAKHYIAHSEQYNNYIEKVKLIKKKLWYKNVINDYANLFTSV